MVESPSREMRLICQKSNCVQIRLFLDEGILTINKVTSLFKKKQLLSALCSLMQTKPYYLPKPSAKKSTVANPRDIVIKEDAKPTAAKSLKIRKMPYGLKKRGR